MIRLRSNAKIQQPLWLRLWLVTVSQPQPRRRRPGKVAGVRVRVSRSHLLEVVAALRLAAAAADSEYRDCRQDSISTGKLPIAATRYLKPCERPRLSESHSRNLAKVQL